MKKHLLFAALFTAAAGTTQAQITLTTATHMPSAGSAHYMAFNDTSASPVMPSVGANQTWNYGNVTPVGFDTVTYFGCTPQANCASFGNANLLLGSPADTFYQYFKTSGNIFQTTGAKTEDFTMRFTDPLDMYRYPLTYNTQFTDVASGTASTPLLPIQPTVTARDTVKGTGYGTLITPAGTFQNVLQVRSAIYVKAVALTQTVLELETITYEWFEASSRFPVMTYIYTKSSDALSGQTIEVYSGSYRVASPAGVQNVGATENFRLSPNPSTGNTRLEIPASFGTNATVLITDISGKKVFSQTAEKNAIIDINTADWAKGIYLVRVQSATGEALMQKLSVQ